MQKVVCIINGKGGVGKDTVCDLVSKYWNSQNVSSITPIVELAKAAGWDGVKTKKARRFLSQLKEICTEFNDLSFQYCSQQYHKFMKSNNEVLFLHIRESKEIERMKAHIKKDCVTLLVRRALLDCESEWFGNASDDEVEHFTYDYILENNGTIAQLEAAAKRLFECLLNKN